MGIIFETLKSLGVAADDTKALFSSGTRDKPNLPVYKDTRSGVIYIDDHYVGDSIYEDGTYRDEDLSTLGCPMLEATMDTERRLKDHRRLYVGRTICEVGCGNGDFLIGAAREAKSAYGVELERRSHKRLGDLGIPCSSVIAEHGTKFESVFAFHCLEHFPDPIAMLRQICDSLNPGGLAVIEVPHANDYLLTGLDCSEFKAFTLWSQHLILHTRESLTAMLKAAGFSNVVIEGRQRFPLSNHLQWLRSGLPGGHKGLLSMIDSEGLTREYEASLRRIDATDTLVAMAG